MKLLPVLAAIVFLTGASAGQPSLRMLDGGDLPSAAQGPVALMFWRSDCPPCLIELRNARNYIAAGSGGQVIFVGLQDEAALRRAAAKLAVPPEALAEAEGDPQTVLKAYGGPVSLPLTVILDAAGRTCFRHAGLLGTETLKEHMGFCGDRDARH